MQLRLVLSDSVVSSAPGTAIPGPSYAAVSGATLDDPIASRGTIAVYKLQDLVSM